MKNKIIHLFDFQKMVFALCAQIPEGSVSTYSEIARAMGKPKACRAVGNALNKNRSSKVPCHRVVKRNGSVGGFAHGTGKKMALLSDEGIEIKQGKILNFASVLKRSFET